MQAADFGNERRALEKEGKELQQRVDMQQHELELLRNQLRDLKDANKGLDSTKFSQEKSLTELALRVQGLQRELEDKESLVQTGQQVQQKLNSLLETTREQKEVTEQTLADERAKTAKM